MQADTTGYNQALLQNLLPDQRTHIQNIIHYAEKRKQERGIWIKRNSSPCSNDNKFELNLLESNKIREAGGYNFTQSVAAGQPTSFNFGGNGSIVNILQNQK